MATYTPKLSHNSKQRKSDNLHQLLKAWARKKEIWLAVTINIKLKV